jgi:hypothetical protein
VLHSAKRLILPDRYTACQLPTITQLANGVQIANCHSLLATTELANGTQLANCHRAR